MIVDIFGKELNVNTTYLITGLVIAFCIYIFLFFKRNPRAGLIECFYVLSSFFTLCVVAIFLIVGYFITVALLHSKQYVGLIVPIGWFYICYRIIKGILITVFKISIPNIVNIDLNWNRIGPAAIFSVMAIGFTFATFAIFSVIPDRNNQPYGPFPLIIAGIIFLFGTVIMYILDYKVITGQMKYIRTGSSSFSSLSNEEALPADATGKEISNAKIKDKRGIKTFFIVWGTFATLFAILFIYLILADKGIIKI